MAAERHGPDETQIVTYLRFSPDTPAEAETSLDVQRAAVRRFAEETRAIIAEEFREEAQAQTWKAFNEACFAAARFKAKLVIASARAIGSSEPLKGLTAPVLQEGYTLATGGPTMSPLDVVILDPFMEVSL